MKVSSYKWLALLLLVLCFPVPVLATNLDCSNYYQLNCSAIPNPSNNSRPNFLGSPIGDLERVVHIPERQLFTTILPSAEDRDGGSISYTLWGKPRYASYDESSHAFNWTPGFTADGQTSRSTLYLRAWDSNCTCVQYTLDLYTEPQAFTASNSSPPLIIDGKPAFGLFADGISLFQGGVNQVDRLRSLNLTGLTSVAWGFYWDMDDIIFDTQYPPGHLERQNRKDAITTQRIRYVKELLDNAASANMKVILHVHQPEVLARPEIAMHTALLAIELPDEPDLRAHDTSNPSLQSYFAPAHYEELARRVREVAPHIPIAVNLSVRFQNIYGNSGDDADVLRQEYERYAALADIVSFDYYPLGDSGGIPRPSSVVRHKILSLVKEARSLLTLDQKPLLVILEATNYSENKAPDEQVNPVTSAWLRMQMKAAIEAGASGIRLYGAADYGDADHNGQLDYHAFEISTELAQALPQINTVLQSGIQSVQMSYDTPLITGANLGVKVLPFENAKAGGYHPMRFIWDLPRRFDTMSSLHCSFENEPTACQEPEISIEAPHNDQFVRIVVSDSEDWVSVALLKYEIGETSLPNVITKLPLVTDSCASSMIKTSPGVCGCNVPDQDLNQNGAVDCLESPLAQPTPNSSPKIVRVEGGLARIIKKGRKYFLQLPSYSGQISASLEFRRKSKAFNISSSNLLIKLPKKIKGTWSLAYAITSGSAFDQLIATRRQRITLPK